jgi:hypothetical protein
MNFLELNQEEVNSAQVVVGIKVKLSILTK